MRNQAVRAAESIIPALPKFHITTPIFYPNAKPHLGHLYSSLLCDVQYRWNKLLGKDCCFTTGTDEHGLKIQTAAQLNGYKDPKMFVDKLYTHFIDMDQKANIQYSRFIRTTDPDHIENVKTLWNICYEKGYIYKGNHEGWYSVSDETFYPDSKILRVMKNGETIPFDGKIDPNAEYINTESRNQVTYQSELNYYFKLSAFQKPLIELLRSNPSFIHPPSRHSQILKELESYDLKDLSISRPETRLKWGISVPNDETQKIYVWFDALCNYISSIGGIKAVLQNGESSPCMHKDRNSIQYAGLFWRNTEHLIGKDIAKFHTIYWPAFLMAAELPLPKRIVIHGHWLSGGVKMSKSLGNVVDPLEIIEHYEADTMRWYLLENSSIDNDGNFNEKNLWETREQLCSKFGNLINRCGGKKFNLRSGVISFANKPVNSMLEQLSDETRSAASALLETMENAPERIEECYKQYDISGSQKIIWNIVNAANSFVQNTEPWTKKDNDMERSAIIYTALDAARVASILSQPIIPTISANLLDRLDVSNDKKTLEYAQFGADDSYGNLTNKRFKEIPIQRIPYRLVTPNE